MATNYTIDFTDQSNNRSFQLFAYATNGPENPTSDGLDSKAASAATSLLLHGKGSPDYGERIQENMIHLLEHFAGSNEPSYPVGGQLWLDRSGSDYVLRVFNTRKHQIITNAAPNAGSNAFVTFQGNHIADFSAAGQLRIINADGGGSTKDEQLNVLATAAVLVSGNTEMGILPVPASSSVGLFVGGWEYIIQNNTGLLEDMPANGWKITNVGTPTSANDAVNMSYVDTQILANNELAELNDVTITGISAGQVLIYDGTVWKNVTGSATGFLPLSGGNMIGEIDMGSNKIRSVAEPMSAQDAATKNYVDTQITSFGGSVPSLLSDLSDVVYSGPLASDDILQFDGAVWSNINQSTYLNSINALLKSGGTMSGNLFLNTDPTANLQAATKQYVDNELLGAISASGDGVVNGGFFDTLNQELTLTRTNGLPSVVVTGFAAGGTSSAAVIHQIGSPTSFQGMFDLFWEQTASVDPAYPNIPLDDLMGELNKSLGNLIRRPPRAVVSATGSADYDIGNDITGTFGDLGFDFVPGFHNLSVFVNGVKYYADEFGFLEVDAVSPPVVVNPPFDTDQMWPGFPTGLSAGIPNYTFTIQLNAGTPSATAALVVTINGGLAQSMGDMITQMLLFSDSNTNTFSGQSSDAIAPYGVVLTDATMVFYSSFPGDDSSVTLTDGGGGGVPLFAALTGGIDAGGREYNFSVAGPTINADGKRNDGVGTNPPAPSTWGYREVGRIGRSSHKFVFTAGSEPPVSTPVEINIDNLAFYDFNPQP